MSTASVLLNMIAPSVPTTSQGSAAVDASAFEGLLAAAMGAGLAGDGEGETKAPKSEKTDVSDAALAAAVVPAQTLPPAPQPILLIPDMEVSAPTGETVITPAADDAAAPVPATPTADAPALDAAPVEPAAVPMPAAPMVAAPVGDAPVAEAPPVITAPAAPTASAPSTATPPTSPLLPGDKPATGKTADTGPQVRPVLTTDKAPVTDTPEVQPLAPTPAVTADKADPAAPLVQPHAPAVARPAGRSGGRSSTDVVADAGSALTLTDAEPTPTATETVKAGTTAQPTTQPLAPAVTAEKTPADTPAPLVQPALVVTDKAAPSDTPVPLVQPVLTPPAPIAAPTVKGQPTVQAEADADQPDAPVAADQPEAVTPDTPEIAPDAAPRTADTGRSVETPTLRALAERAARPVETNAAVDTSAPMTPTAAASPTAPSIATGAVQTPTPRPELAAAADVAVDAVDSPSDGPVDAVAPEAPPSAQTAAATREALPSTLSRASVEATAQIAAQILSKLNGRSTRFEMSLTPDELGRVDVKLEIDAEGRLAARLAFDNPAAATDLKGRADELRRQLEQQGFHLADDAFEFTQRDSGSSAFDRGQDARQGQEQGQSRAFAAANRLTTETDTAAQPPRWQALSLTPTGVDMKV